MLLHGHHNVTSSTKGLVQCRRLACCTGKKSPETQVSMLLKQCLELQSLHNCQRHMQANNCGAALWQSACLLWRKNCVPPWKENRLPQGSYLPVSLPAYSAKTCGRLCSRNQGSHAANINNKPACKCMLTVQQLTDRWQKEE